MPKDGLKRLPDQVVAPLLRALMMIPRRPDSRLILRPADEPRPPVHRFEKDSDFNVLWRDRIVGRIWKCDYTGSTSGEIARYLWHWRRQHAEFRQTFVTLLRLRRRVTSLR